MTARFAIRFFIVFSSVALEYQSSNRRCYDLCVNKADLEIKALVPHLAAMLR